MEQGELLAAAAAYLVIRVGVSRSERAPPLTRESPWLLQSSRLLLTVRSDVEVQEAHYEKGQ
jgi:hypothetical protein